MIGYLHAAEAEHTAEVGAGGVEARAEGVIEGVLGVEEEDVRLPAAPARYGRHSQWMGRTGMLRSRRKQAGSSRGMGGPPGRCGQSHPSVSCRMGI